MKFCAKPGDSVTQTFNKMFKVFRDDSMSRTQVFWWHKEFKNGRENVADKPQSGRGRLK